MSMTFGDSRYDWDENKNQSNIRKHGVSFEEATDVFDDDMVVLIPDDEHSYEEERFIAIGFSHKNRILPVCYCERHSQEITRIISARPANNTEKILYRGGFQA